MAAPFPGAQDIVYTVLGSLATLVAVLLLYIRRLHTRMDRETGKNEPDLEVDRMGLSRSAEETLEAVLKEPELQSDLPSKLEVSKATVSNAVSELFERGLVRKKKKANTYLIEPEIDEIRKQQK